jgi:hypothetical protein
MDAADPRMAFKKKYLYTNFQIPLKLKYLLAASKTVLLVVA